MRSSHDTRTSPQHLGVAILGSFVLVAAIVVTSIQDGSAFGTPGYWAWILTGFQVVALRAAATGRSSGWLLGASVQLPWIAYALVTSQFGFIPGCLISAVVQANGYLRRSPTSHLKKPTYA